MVKYRPESIFFQNIVMSLKSIKRSPPSFKVRLGHILRREVIYYFSEISFLKPPWPVMIFLLLFKSLETKRAKSIKEFLPKGDENYVMDPPLLQRDKGKGFPNQRSRKSSRRHWNLCYGVVLLRITAKKRRSCYSLK